MGGLLGRFHLGLHDATFGRFGIDDCEDSRGLGTGDLSIGNFQGLLGNFVYSIAMPAIPLVALRT